jgi:hypothetical protein
VQGAVGAAEIDKVTVVQRRGDLIKDIERESIQTLRLHGKQKQKWTGRIKGT